MHLLLSQTEDGEASMGWHADDEGLFQGKLEDISALAIWDLQRRGDMLVSWGQAEFLGCFSMGHLGSHKPRGKLT